MATGLFGPVWSRDRMLLGDRVRWSDVSVVRTPDESSLLVVVRRDERTTLLGRGEPRGVVALVEDWAAGHVSAPLGRGWMSIPRGAPAPATLLDRLGLERFSTWDWLVTEDVPPRVPDEDAVVRLDPVADADAIRACLAAANPGTTADPVAPTEAAWVGVRDGDELLGVFGAAVRGGRTDAGFSWHLHGLGVRPETRGRGLGAALTAALTRAGLAAGADWVSLGMYADNDAARRIYRRLGFTTEAEFDSYGPAGSRRPPT